MAQPPALVGFNPGREAEPTSQQSTEEENPAPSVLNKLQKWADYPAMGSPVRPTRFIPCKTPMSNEILDNWSLAAAPQHALTVPVLLQAQAAAGRRVGLIIDLANHDCLYSDDMPDSLEYEHVQLVAKVLPSRAAIDEVQRIATSFWRDHPEQYIAIHCAYGFNRTGFVVCSFLCQACGLSVEQALESFAASRPPGVKHEKFVRELYARYGGGTASLAASRTASPAASPPKDALGAPQPERVDGLAAEAELLLQHSAAVAAAASAQAAAGVAGSPAAGKLLPQLAPGEEEDHHFEDAADMVRRSSQHRRTLSVRSGSGGGDALPPSASPGSRPGSACSSRNASRHGGSAAAEAAAGGGEAPPPDADGGFEASRRLLQRRPSRGGALAQALGGGGSQEAAPPPLPAGSAAAAAAEDAGGASPGSGQRTSASSLSDFAAAAAHLEGQAGSGSMRRTTSLGLARALSEDFLQNNGTPDAAAPISALGSAQLAAAWAAQVAGCQPPVDAPQEGPQQAAAREQHHGPRQACVPGQADASVCVAAGQRRGGGPCAGEPGAGSPPKLGSSPSRHGGVPPPPRAQLPPQLSPHCAWAYQQGHQQGQQLSGQDGVPPLGQPGTPATPGSHAGLSALGSTGQRQGFPRSASLDSDNPSLGFGMREALHHLRLGAAPAGSNVRGPQALADLFREDSRGELTEVDVEEHLAALARASGGESPAVPGPLPRVVEDAAAAALLRGGIALPAATGLAAQEQQQGLPLGAQGSSLPLPALDAHAKQGGTDGRGTCAVS